MGDSADQPAPKQKRRTGAPAAIEITDEMRAWARAEGVRCNLEAETARMLDHHRAKGNVMSDWAAAWRTWMSRSKTFGPAVRGGSDAMSVIDAAQERLNVGSAS